METSLGDRQFNRAYISMRDMDRCIESLECAASALESKDYKAARALITAAVVCYARPFSGNIDHPRAIAHPSFKLSTLSPEERALHKHRSEEHTSELQSLMRISYAVFCLKKKTTKNHNHQKHNDPEI